MMTDKQRLKILDVLHSVKAEVKKMSLPFKVEILDTIDQKRGKLQPNQYMLSSDEGITVGFGVVFGDVNYFNDGNYVWFGRHELGDEYYKVIDRLLRNCVKTAIRKLKLTGPLWAKLDNAPVDECLEQLYNLTSHVGTE